MPTVLVLTFRMPAVGSVPRIASQLGPPNPPTVLPPTSYDPPMVPPRISYAPPYGPARYLVRTSYPISLFSLSVTSLCHTSSTNPAYRATSTSYVAG
eukprot:2546773-Rhodomonas_salina.1